VLPERISFTAALLRERLAATKVPKDPTNVIMPPGSEHWPAFMREQLMQTLKPAGVLIPVIERPDGLSVLLTQRSAELKHHAGQVSFPGGRMEEADRDIVQTALREAHEEVGIPPDSIAVIGYLQPMLTVTGYAVTAVIGLIAAAVPLDLDRTEVEYAFEVPRRWSMRSRCHYRFCSTSVISARRSANSRAAGFRPSNFAMATNTSGVRQRTC